MNPSNEFQSRGFCLIKSAISNELRDFVTQYALFDEMQNFIDDRDQVPGSHGKYADPAIETLLLKLQSSIEQATKLKLYPTYSYYRVYRSGHELEKHRDRPSCEVSATLFLNDNAMNEHSPIYMSNNKVILEPGDMLIYRGCDLEHYREKMAGLEDAWHVQAFLHYVDANGPFSEYKWDKRQSIGLPTGIYPRYIERA